MSIRRFSSLIVAAGALGIGAYAFYWGTTQLSSVRPVAAPEAMRVRLPIPVQVFMAMGDRYLAANMNVFRATVLGGDRHDPTTYAVLGKVQVDAAFLNPGNEDNYYIASAILPWEGEVDAAQIVLRLATEGRQADPYPPFYYGFNQQYFRGDFIGAARAAEVAAARVEGGARQTLLNIASKWYERLDDPKLAEQTIQALIASTRDAALREHLQKRVVRVRQLAQLRAAAQIYRERFGRPLTTPQELLQSDLIQSLPQDPLGDGFRIENGTVVVNRPSGR